MHQTLKHLSGFLHSVSLVYIIMRIWSEIERFFALEVAVCAGGAGDLAKKSTKFWYMCKNTLNK